MNYLIFYIILLCCISIIILALLNCRSLNKQISKLENLEKENLKEYFKEEWKVEQDKLDLKISGLESTLKEKEKRYKEVNQDLDLYREGKLKEIDSATAEYEQRQQLIVDNGIEQYRNIKTNQFNEYLNTLFQEKNEAFDELSKIRQELTEEYQKRAVINEEILRQRKIAEEQDFYKIQFTEADKKDIEILRPIAPRLQHPEVINKIIWTSYYQKPLAELRKRLLPNGDVSGIYKITRIKTKEIYIGQSTSIDRRFQDHVKTALGVGTLANSHFHKVMAQDGPENFFFEILEEVEKDKLRERESYYINWFKSDKFGLNTLSGDKNK